jgi:hypothetical protein
VALAGTNGPNGTHDGPGQIRPLVPPDQVIEERPAVAVPAGNGETRERETEARR